MAAEPITVHYLPESDNRTVNVTSGGTVLTGQAPGLIAARDRAEQLVETLTEQNGGRIVVHLLAGDAFAFTTTYLHARHGMTSNVYPAPGQAGPPPLTGEHPPKLDLSE